MKENALKLSKYHEICLMEILKVTPDIIGLMRNKNSINENDENKEIILDLPENETDDFRTTIRTFRSIWDDFSEFCKQQPHTQKELLSMALKEYMMKHTDVEKLNMRKSFRKIYEEIKQNNIQLETISEILTLVREYRYKLNEFEVANLLDIPIDVLRNHVVVIDKKSFLRSGSYFAGNMNTTNDEYMKSFKKKFENQNFSLDDISEILEYAQKNFKVLGNSIDFILRNPEVVIRDDVKLQSTKKFNESSKIYCDKIENVLSIKEIESSSILELVIKREFKVPNITIEDIDKYKIVDGFSGKNEVKILFDEKVERLHLMLGAGRSNYDKVREFLKHNQIDVNLSNEEIDTIYYDLNKIFFEYRAMEERIENELNL